MTGYVTAFLYLCGMRKVYHFKMLRTAALILLGAPAFVAAGLLLIRLHPDNLPVRIASYAGILFSEAVSLPDCSSSDGWRKTAKR